MLINNRDVSVDEAISFANYNNLLLSRRDNGLLLSDYQVDILNRNGINYKNFSNIKDLMFEIENMLDEEFNEELDIISSQLAEYIYYKDFNK